MAGLEVPCRRSIDPWLLVGTPAGTSHSPVAQTIPGVWPGCGSDQFLGRVAAPSACLLNVTSCLMLPLNPGNTNGWDIVLSQWVRWTGTQSVLRVRTPGAGSLEEAGMPLPWARGQAS